MRPGSCRVWSARPRRPSWPCSASRCRRVDAERFGLVARVVPADALAGEARAVATRLAGLAPIALAQTKRALERSWSTGLDVALEEEAYRQGIAGATADHAEGLAAFLEKRPPRFRGE